MLLALNFSAAAQQPAKKIPRIGILSPGSGNRGIDAFLKRLHELGWVEGQNIALDYGLGNGNEDRLPVLAAQLVRANVDVIVATNPQAAHAAMKFTNTIPVIVTAMNNPVASGLVKSLSQPGRNVTGLSYMSSDLNGKRLEVLSEIIPRLSRVGILMHRLDITAGDNSQIQVVARSLGVQLQIVNVRKPEEIENAFSTMVRGKAEAVAVGTQGMFSRNQRRIVKAAAKNRLPAIYHRREFVEAGGLMSYGPDHVDLYRRAAFYVDRILKGAKPSDLPVEQPTKFRLVVNLKTAKTLGLTIPSKVLMWADRVIE
jgi:putative ABC transport system substrate-binding protein